MDNAHVDRIGDRLDHPELVPEAQRHLIADDHQRVKRILDFPVSGRVIDIGSSDGSISARIMARHDVRVLRTDIRTDLEDFGIQHWDARESPPRDWLSYFDYAYCCEVFEHMSLHEATLALRNICAVLKPGGDLIVTTPNRYPRHPNTDRHRWRWPDHWSVWDVVSLEHFLLPHFDRLEWVPHYEHDTSSSGIFLIVRATGRL